MSDWDDYAPQGINGSAIMFVKEPLTTNIICGPRTREFEFENKGKHPYWVIHPLTGKRQRVAPGKKRVCLIALK